MNQTLVFKFLKMLQLVRELSPEGVLTVNLDSLDFKVTERLIEDRISSDFSMFSLVLHIVYSPKKSQPIV